MLYGLAALATLAGCGEVRLPDPDVLTIAFGDSSTAGPTEQDYPDFLPAELGVGQETVANEGDGGETAAEGLERMQRLIADGIFPNGQRLIYWEGGNALVQFLRQTDPFLLFSPSSENYPFDPFLVEKMDEIQADVEAAIRSGQQAGWEVYVVTYYLRAEIILPCEALPINVMTPGQARIANEYTQMLNQRIRQAAANTGAELIDVALLSQQLRTDGSNYHDCNHLSATGNAAVAAYIAEAILNQ